MTAARRDTDQPGEPPAPTMRPVAVRPVPSGSVWWARLAHRAPLTPGRGGAEHSLVAVRSDRFPDGTPVDLTAVDPRGRRPAGWLVDLRYRAADGSVVAAEVSERVADPALPLWFAEVAHATSDIPAASIHAFIGDALPPGAFVTPREVAARGVRMADRIGEIRWWTRSGLLDVLTVEPDGRGHGIGLALGHLAETLAVFRGWAPLTVGEDSRADDVRCDGAPEDWRPRLRPAG
jgi:hypothetical protein